MKEWKTVENYPDYQVSNEGEIRIEGLGVKVPSRITKGGHKHVYLYKESTQYGYSLDKLILDAFKPEEKTDWVIHINGNNMDCRLSNLRWGTREEAIRNDIAYYNKMHGILFSSKRVGVFPPKVTRKSDI